MNDIGCKHNIPVFQSCPACGREMTGSPLTKQFQFIKFPKSIPKPKRTMIDYARAKNKPHMPLKRMKKVKRTKLPSIKSLKKRAWDLFSIFIRNRDSRCVLCNSVKGFSAGHLIPTGKSATKFDENNVFGLCSTCNFRDRFERGYHDRYVAWYFIKFGAGRYIKLVEKSQQLKQRKRIDYLEIIKRYGPTNPKP